MIADVGCCCCMSTSFLYFMHVDVEDLRPCVKYGDTHIFRNEMVNDSSFLVVQDTVGGVLLVHSLDPQHILGGYLKASDILLDNNYGAHVRKFMLKNKEAGLSGGPLLGNREASFLGVASRRSMQVGTCLKP